ncbi:chemotaxis protein [Scandinavium manionii]|uniref:chemotaxis protein n=1 Tax=Scandinavium manionii TaxID=2926520 RepID=UPI0021667CBB|nr:chemotaxis protein [Scandinavium manionii]MCS2164987.1 chemotaxis protein [Scandinavium manionii]
MSGNIIVTTTRNDVIWSVDQNSYSRALKKIKSLKEEQEKPSKQYQQTQKKIQQSEGKAALQAAKAQTQRLKLAQQLGAEQQKQAQAQAKIAKQEQAHALKMQNLNARSHAQQLSDAELLARQNSRLARISEKVRTAMTHRAHSYNPDMGGHFADPNVVSRQNAAMNRGHGAVAAEIAAQKRSLAIEEKKEAALKREVTYYNSLRRSALVLANVRGGDVATRYKAISAAKEALKAQKEERYTVEETRFEMARITTELRKQARLQQRITREQKAAGARAGRVRTEGRGGRSGLAAAGVIGGAALAGSMGISRVSETLQGSLERSRDVKKLQQYGISNLEFAALQDLSMSRVGYSLSADKLSDLNKDTLEKSGELLNTGSFKRNKKTGQVNFSGGGEFADIINNVLTSTNGNQKVAQKVIGELQKLDFPTFITYLKQLQKTFKWTDNQTRHLAEAVNDGSVFLDVFNDEGQGVIDRMTKLSSEGWALSDAQQAQLDKLSALSTEYSRVQTSLSDHFSASFVNGLGEYATNTDNLSKGFSGLIPITDGLGKSLGEMTAAVLKLTSWISSIDINPENKHEELNKSGWYYDDSAVGWVVNKVKSAAATFTRASTIPGVQGMPSQTYGSGTAFNNPALALNVPGFSYQAPQPTFTAPTMDSMTQQRQPIPVSVTGQASITLSPIDINVNDGAVNNLIDARIHDNNQAQNNLILGVPQ